MNCIVPMNQRKEKKIPPKEAWKGPFKKKHCQLSLADFVVSGAHTGHIFG